MRFIQVTKRLIPLAVSLILLGGVIWWVSPAELLQAAANLNWRLMLSATATMVLALYLWDAACLPIVYGIEARSLSYWQALHLRGLSYMLGALNYELGQAALAWGMARLQNASLIRMLARSVLLAYHDILILLGLGLAGSLLANDPRAERILPFLATAFAGALAVGAIFWALPERLRARFSLADGQSVLAGWDARRSLTLIPMRLVYFGILIIYAAAALRICQIPIDSEVVLSTIPLVLLADGLPNFAGLGTRETSLQLLLAPGARDAALLAMSLFWTTGMILGRFVIGLAHVWAQQVLYGSPFDLRPPSDQPLTRPNQGR